MSAKNFLQEDFRRFSDRVVAAAADGRLNAEPLINLLERASAVASGVSAVLTIEAANTVRNEVSAPDDGLEPPLSSGIMYNLIGLARVAADSLEREIERVAEWADEHGINERAEI